MNYFAQRCRCNKCEIINHIFIDLNDLDKKPLSDHEIAVNYSIEMSKINGKWIKQFMFGYICPWCKSYNTHETVYKGSVIN